jgi:hypothetical protein
MMAEPGSIHQKASIPDARAPLHAVRRLAELCGVASASTPLPRLASEMLSDPECAATVHAYLVWWMRNPDKGSTFETRTAALRELPEGEIVPSLQRLGYDGLLYLCGDEIVGHVFFQRREGDLSAFSLAVTKSFRGGRRWTTFSLDCLAYAAALPGVRRTSVGTGRNMLARSLVKFIRAHAAELGWQAHDDGWIEFDGAAKD